MIRYFVLGVFCVLRAFTVVAQLPLTATVKSPENNTVYIAPLVGPAEPVNVDSAFVSNGQFVISGDYQSYALYRVWFKGVDKPEQKIILHPSVSLQFNGQFDWEPSETDSVNSCYSRFRAKHETFIDEIMRLSLETDNRSLQDSLYKQRAHVYKAYIDTFKHELIDNRTNPAAAAALYELIIRDKLQPPAELKGLYSLLSEPVLASYYGYKIGAYLNREQQVSLGSLAPEFRLPTNKGKLVSLNQLKGRYILLIFWASWCGPCRVENRELSQLTSRLSRKLHLVSVSLDTSQQKWLAASQKDGINWINL